MPDAFKKSKPPNFDGDLKKPKDADSWILGVNTFFELHEYKENMKAIITIFNLKHKADIWWEDVKQVKDIRMEDLSWHEFKRLFKKKYLSEKYYDGKAKGLYELKMGSLTDEECMTKFLELLSYVLYIRYEKAKVQSFVSGCPLEFRD